MHRARDPSRRGICHRVAVFQHVSALFRSVCRLALAATGAFVFAPAAGATVGTPQYPDLRALPPADLALDQIAVDGVPHHVVRFTTTTWNAGPGPFELHGRPHAPPDGMMDATQWIYEEPVGVGEEFVGVFAFHEAHRHFHFTDYAAYELWTKGEFQRARATGFAHGRPLFTAGKVGFCLLDYDRVTAPESSTGFYFTCTPVLQGMSVGWGDVYDSSLADQWVDVGTSPLPDGDYVLRNVVDPNNRVYESEGKADLAREGVPANSATTDFSVVAGALLVTQ